MKAKVEIPGMLSMLAFGDVHAPVRGLDEFPTENRPPLWLTFVSFHNMVVLGMFFIFASMYGTWRWWKGDLFTRTKFLRILSWAIPLPLLACELGWMAAEVGRQPWIVYGVMRTSNAHSANLTAGELIFSLILFTGIYLALGSLYLYLVITKVRHGPPMPRDAYQIEREVPVLPAGKDVVHL